MIEAILSRAAGRGTAVALAIVATLSSLACGDAQENAGAAAAPERAPPAISSPAPPAETTATSDAGATPAPAHATAGTGASDAMARDDRTAGSGGARGAAAPAANATDPQDEGVRALRAAAAAYEQLRSLRAGFTMVVQNPLLRRTTTSRGTLYQRSPDRIKLEFTDPVGDVIVGDGTWFWIWYPSVDSLQVMRSPAAQAGSAGVDLRAQFVGNPLERFRHVLNGTETVADREATVLTLIPIEDAGYRQLMVWIDARDGLARRFEITEHSGLTRRFDLERLEINPALADAIFRFTPPAGARIIERT